MASPLAYPLINGKRQDGNSIVLNLAGQQFKGFDSIDYSYTKERPMMYGAHPDPLAKGVGKNTYKASCELYLAEWNYWLNNVLIPAALAQGWAVTGSGVAQLPLVIVVNYLSPGMDLVTDTLVGCTLDGLEGNNKVGTEFIKRKVELAPLKIYYGGIELESVALGPDPGM